MAITTAFTELVGCTIPIQQAGMGGASTPQLAAAVSAAGALGTLSGVMGTDLGAQLDAVARSTAAPVGVNFLVPFVDPELVELAASRARLVEFFYGDPDPVLVATVHAGGALAAWQVGSVDEARAALAAGCDLVTAQGSEAGGHVRGTIAMLPLLEGVLDAVGEWVPVVGAGGIGTARSVAAALAAGAAGVRVGTRFVATEEAGAHPDYQRALVAASSGDTVLTTAFSVMWPDAPHRVLRSCVEAAGAFDGESVGEIDVGGSRIPVPRFAVMPPDRTATGAIGAMALYAGESAGAVTGVARAADVVRELAEGAERLLTRWGDPS